MDIFGRMQRETSYLPISIDLWGMVDNRTCAEYRVDQLTCLGLLGLLRDSNPTSQKSVSKIEHATRRMAPQPPLSEGGMDIGFMIPAASLRASAGRADRETIA